MYFRNQKNYYFYLAAILLVGGFLRLNNIGEVGLNHYDSAYYANIAKTPIFAAKWLLSEEAGGNSIQDLGDYLKSRGCGVNIIKPGHVFLISLSFLLFGIYDYAVVLVSAICGLGVIVVTFMIGKRLFDQGVGLVGATIVAVSGQQVIFSRTGWPQMDTVLIFCVSFLLFWSWMLDTSRRKHFVFSAILSGSLLLFHQSVYLVLAPLLLAIFLVKSERKNHKWRHRVKDFIYYLLIMLAVFSTAQIVVWAINSINPSGGMDLLGRNAGRIRSGAFDRWGISIDKLLFYPQMFWKLEGPAVATLIPVSMIFILWKAFKTWKMKYVHLGMLTSFPLVFWILNYTTLKAIQVCMPFVAVGIGVFLIAALRAASEHWEKNSKTIRSAALAGLVIFFLLSGFIKSYPILDLRSNYKIAVDKLVDYMKIEGGNFSVKQENLWTIMAFYVGNKIDAVGNSFKGNFFFHDFKDKSDYRIIDWRQFVPGKADIDALIKTVNENEAIIDLNNNEKPFPLWNYHRYYDINRIPSLFEKYPEAGRILVYDLRKDKNGHRRE